MSDILYTAYLKESLKLSKSGEWFHSGIPFSNARVISLFNRSIVWDTQNACYVVRIGKQQAVFECEDTPYFVVELLDKMTPWQINLSDETKEVLREETLSIGVNNQFYCFVKDGHRARFSRSAHQTLLSHAVNENTLKINGRKITPAII